MCVFFRLERISDEDFRRAEEFVEVMKILYTSTICISSERSPTLGQILPILGKLQQHFTVTAEDSSFTHTIKDKIWGDLSKLLLFGVIWYTQKPNFYTMFLSCRMRVFGSFWRRPWPWTQDLSQKWKMQCGPDLGRS